MRSPVNCEVSDSANLELKYLLVKSKVIEGFP